MESKKIYQWLKDKIVWMDLKPGEKISSDELISKADSVLYSAKNKGRNQCSFFEYKN